MKAAPRPSRPTAEAERGRARPFFAAAGVQARLRVGRPGDRSEREADAAADAAAHHRGPLAGRAVARHLTPAQLERSAEPAVRRSPLDEEAREGVQASPAPDTDAPPAASAQDRDEVQARAAPQPRDVAKDEEAQAREEERDTGDAEEVQARADDEKEVQPRAAGRRPVAPGMPLGAVEERLRAARGLGSPLPEPARARMEAAFGAPLAGVRIHTDALAGRLAEALGAQAFAHGRDLYFGANRFAPGTAAGDHLIAHELAHVVQQGAIAAGEPERAEDRGLEAGMPGEAAAGAHAEPPLPGPPEHAEAPPVPDLPATEAEQDAAADPGPTDVSDLERPVEAAAEPLPAPEAEVAVELPEAPPIPPPEPVAAVEKVALQGASETMLADFAAAPASAVAATAPDLGPALDARIAAEQAEAAAAAPELTAATSGELDPGITPPAEAPSAGAAAIGDGVTGATPPELTAAPHQDRGPPPSTAGEKRLIDEQPEGGFLDWLRGAIRSLMGRLRTTDPGVSTSAGARPQIGLEGDADPGRMDRQREEGADQLGAQRDTQAEAFRTHPGQSNIAPRAIDETFAAGLAAEPAARIEPLPPASDAEAYATAELPADVRARADLDLRPVLEPGLDAARTAALDAAREREAETVAEKAAASEQARAINATADAKQRSIVADGRRDVAAQQAEGIAESHEQVRQFADEAAREETSRRKQVGDHVGGEEDKARKELEDGEKKAEAEKRAKEKEAADEKTRLEQEQKSDSWWSRAASAVKRAVKAVTAAIDVIFTALREAVAAIIEAAKNAAVALINRARDWVVARLNEFRDWAKAQVDRYLKDAFPGLARRINAAIDSVVDGAVAAVNAVADAAIAAVEALAAGLAAALDRILATFQTALKAAVGIAGAVLTGDFAEALRIAVQAACDIAGVDSGPVFAFFDRAGSLIGSILRNPLAFINNLMSAVGQGVRQFADRILEHLQRGLIAWLTGALGEAGITLPERFDLMGIFSLVAQILGLTYANVKARIIRKFPAAERVFDLVERGFALVMKLKDLDFSGLWEEARSRLAGLRETVLGGIRSWLVTNVIESGIVWLLSLLNPAGAIARALKLVYDLVMWLVERFNQIRDFVVSVYEAVARIAAGVLGPAAAAVEDALARSLPVVISLLANLIGLGGIGTAIRNVLERITAPINRVIDAIIDRVVAYARTLVSKAKEGAKKAVAAIKNFIWPKRTFQDGARTHTLEVAPAGGARRLVVRSTPVPVEAFLAEWKKTNPTPSAEEQALLARIEAVLPKARGLIAKIDAAITADKDVPAADGKALLDLSTELSAALGKLVSFNSALAKGKIRFKLEGLAGTYVEMVRMKGDALTPDHQPQAKVFEILAGKWYYQPPHGQALRARAANRAASGFVVNLSHRRHVAGRTYGRKPTEFESALAGLEGSEGKARPASEKKAESLGKKLRQGVVAALKEEVRADVSAIKRVVDDRDQAAPHWSDLDAFTTGNKQKRVQQKSELMTHIRAQVLRGQEAVARQPFTGFEA